MISRKDEDFQPDNVHEGAICNQMKSLLVKRQKRSRDESYKGNRSRSELLSLLAGIFDNLPNFNMGKLYGQEREYNPSHSYNYNDVIDDIAKCVRKHLFQDKEEYNPYNQAFGDSNLPSVEGNCR